MPKDSKPRDFFKFLDEIPYSILIITGVFLVPAPFTPAPHVVEKLIMLKQGALTKPIDIFDLFFHLLPIIVMVMKGIRNRSKRHAPNE